MTHALALVEKGLAPSKNAPPVFPAKDSYQGVPSVQALGKSKTVRLWPMDFM